MTKKSTKKPATLDDVTKQLARIADALQAQAEQEGEFKRSVIEFVTGRLETILNVKPVNTEPAHETCTCGHPRSIHVLDAVCAVPNCPCQTFYGKICSACPHPVAWHHPNSGECDATMSSDGTDCPCAGVSYAGRAEGG